MKNLSLLLLAAFLIGCGGGGGDGGGGNHPPAISNIQFSPTSVSGGAGGGVFTVYGTMDVTDNGGDVATVILSTYDSAGNPLDSITTPISGFSGVHSFTLNGSITFGTLIKGVFTFKVQVMDAAGSASNILEGSFSVTSPGFTQSDITGTWDVVSIRCGQDAGWFRATIAFDAAGNATAITNFLDSTGSTPGSNPLQWTIDSTGVVSQFDDNILIGYHGKMSSDKKLISFVGTQNVMPYTVQMTIARKRTGTVFSNTDLASIPFAYHALVSGSDNNWEYGAGATNASRQLTIASTTLPPGYTVSLPPSNFDTLSVNPAGIVTLFNDNTFYGLMTDDKKVIFTIMNGPTSASSRLEVIMVTGQTFTQADYAGAFPFVEFRNLPYLMWAFGIGSIDATGNGSYLSFQDSLLPGLLPRPPTYIRLLSATGVITDPTDGNFHGQISYNKDITVQTNTIRGSHGMNIGFRR